MATMAGVEPAELGEEVGPHQGAARRGRRRRRAPRRAGRGRSRPPAPARRPRRSCRRSSRRAGGPTGRPSAPSWARRSRRWSGRTPRPGRWTASGSGAQSSWQRRKKAAPSTIPMTSLAAAPKPPVVVEAPHEGVGEDPAHPGASGPRPRPPPAPGRQLGVVLGGQRGQGLLEPRTRVPGDDHRHHRRCAGVHRGVVHQISEAIRFPLRPLLGGGRSRDPVGVLATVYQTVYYRCHNDRAAGSRRRPAPTGGHHAGTERPDQRGDHPRPRRRLRGGRALGVTRASRRPRSSGWTLQNKLAGDLGLERAGWPTSAPAVTSGRPRTSTSIVEGPSSSWSRRSSRSRSSCPRPPGTLAEKAHAQVRDGPAPAPATSWPPAPDRGPIAIPAPSGPASCSAVQRAGPPSTRARRAACRRGGSRASSRWPPPAGAGSPRSTGTSTGRTRSGSVTSSRSAPARASSRAATSATATSWPEQTL